jgi:predicted DNA-binding ribbon-helix-helix protein
MKSLVVKRSVVIDSHKTSVSLEDEFWKNLREIAHGRNETLSHLISTIDKDRQSANLSSAIRLFVLRHYSDRFHQLPKTSLHHSVDVSIVPRD